MAEKRFDYPKVVCDEWPANEISTEIANVFVAFEGDIVLTSDERLSLSVHGNLGVGGATGYGNGRPTDAPLAVAGADE